MRSLGLALAALLPLLVPAVGSAKQADVSIGRLRQAGERADVYDGRHAQLPEHTVVKIPKPGIWIASRLHFRTDAVMKDHAERLMGAAKALKSDPQAGQWFRRILPSYAVDGELPGWIFMTPHQGSALGSLGGRAARVARQEMARALEAAGRIVGEVDPAEDNFLFDGKGRITAWLSPIRQPHGSQLPFEYVGKAGEGRNSDAYLIKNHAPGQAHLTVLKIARPYSAGRGTPINTEVVRDDVAREVEYIAGVLRERFTMELGIPVIPESRTPAPGIVLQERVQGVSHYALERRLGEHGMKVYRRAQAIGVELFPKAPWSDSYSDHHVLFDGKTGLPSGWYDFLNDNKIYHRSRPQ
jgi:hypothetical protein